MVEISANKDFSREIGLGEIEIFSIDKTYKHTYKMLLINNHLK